MRASSMFYNSRTKFAACDALTVPDCGAFKLLCISTFSNSIPATMS